MKATTSIETAVAVREASNRASRALPALALSVAILVWAMFSVQSVDARESEGSADKGSGVPVEVVEAEGEVGAGDVLFVPGDYVPAEGASITLEDEAGATGTLTDGANASLIPGSAGMGVLVEGEPTDNGGGDSGLDTSGLSMVSSTDVVEAEPRSAAAAAGEEPAGEEADEEPFGEQGEPGMPPENPGELPEADHLKREMREQIDEQLSAAGIDPGERSTGEPTIEADEQEAGESGDGMFPECFPFCEVDPSEVDPSEVDPSEVDPSEVDPSEVDPSEVDPPAGDSGQDSTESTTETNESTTETNESTTETNESTQSGDGDSGTTGNEERSPDGSASDPAGSDTEGSGDPDTGGSGDPGTAPDLTGATCDDDFGGVEPHVQAVGCHVKEKFDVGEVHGYRENDPQDHGKGLALDYMVFEDRAKGDAISDYHLENQAEFRVTYVIWYQQINFGSGWQPMDDRGSDTENHIDHPHVSHEAA